MQFALIILDSTAKIGIGLGLVAGLFLAYFARRCFSAICENTAPVVSMQQTTIVSLWLIWCGVIVELFTRTSSPLGGRLTQSESVLLGALTAFLFVFCATIKRPQ